MSQPVMDNDFDLLRAIGRGDRQAFARFYDIYARLAFSLAARIVNDEADAGEVVREVFLQIWDRAGAYHPGLGKPCSWVVALTRNKAVDYLHAYQDGEILRGRVAADMTIRKPGEVTANESIRRKETAEQVCTALAALPEEQRRAIEVCFFTGLSQKDMSAQMSQPPEIIRMRIRAGLLALRKKWEGLV